MKLNQIFNLVMATCVITFFSCEKERVSPAENEVLVTDIESPVPDNCESEIIGDHSVFPNTNEFYTFDIDFTPDLVFWSVASGDITIISGQGTTTVTLQFGSGFNGGSISAFATNEFEGKQCSDEFYIAKDCTVPITIGLTQVNEYCHGDYVSFQAQTDDLYSGTYQWTVSSYATIISGQGTSYLTVEPPFGGNMTVSVEYTSSCKSTKLNAFKNTQYDESCPPLT